MVSVFQLESLIKETEEAGFKITGVFEGGAGSSCKDSSNTIALLMKK